MSATKTSTVGDVRIVNGQSGAHERTVLFESGRYGARSSADKYLCITVYLWNYPDCSDPSILVRSNSETFDVVGVRRMAAMMNIVAEWLEVNV